MRIRDDSVEPMFEEEKMPARDAGGTLREPVSRRAKDWSARVWRPAGTAVVILLALGLGWHVVNGKDGLSVWEHKRQQDKELQKEIEQLQQENQRLNLRVNRLKSDPDAIEREAREKLHYAKPGEVIYDLPADPGQAQGNQPGR